MLNAIRHGLANLFRFSGRDPRSRFWLYAAFVYLLTQALSILVMAPFMGRIFTMSFEQARRASEAPGPEAIGPMMQENFTAVFSAMSGIIYLSFAITLLAVLLLAAAVTRRLHDSGRSGAWGLLPLPFLLGGLVLMQRFIDSLPPSGAASAPFDQGTFMMMMLANFLYLGCLVLLIVFLALAGTPGENGYGPPPPPANAAA